MSPGVLEAGFWVDVEGADMNGLSPFVPFAMTAVRPDPYTGPMRTPSPDPHRLDVAALARAKACLKVRTPLLDLRRLLDTTVAQADGVAGGVDWSAQGLWKQPVGAAPEIRLHLRARADVWLTCQRCLQPARHTLEVDRVIRLVEGEEAAERLDEESEEDVLELMRQMDLMDLLEDELILTLPIVPRHEQCPYPLMVSEEASAHMEAEDAAPANPFAVLAQLKRR
jgi:uncharacterized protein